MQRKCEVTAFIDWNSQTYNAGINRDHAKNGRGMDRVAQYVTRALDDILVQYKEWDRFDVDVRLYYGWYQGLTKTKSRQELERLAADGGLPRSRGRCTFNWSSLFGDRLLSALDRRLHRRLNLHLPDTLREDSSGKSREKMIDTALVADLLSVSRSNSTGWKIVMAEDDDVIPGIMVAERWSHEHGGKCLLARRREDTGHLRIDELLCIIKDDLRE